MIGRLRNMFRVPDLRNKILFTLLIIAAYRVGAHIPVPFVDFTAIQQIQKNASNNGIVGFLDLFSGGAITSVSVFFLGVMPYITAFFMPRQAGDRPDVVPQGAVNFAFIGQFAESAERDCIFTTEYSVRTPMEAVYTLMNVERGVPEVFNSTYDIRTLLAAVTPVPDFGDTFHDYWVIYTPDEIRMAIDGYAALGIAELVFSPTATDVAQVDRLADVAFR